MPSKNPVFEQTTMQRRNSMRQFRLFVYAFITTVLIAGAMMMGSGALMVGCGGGDSSSGPVNCIGSGFPCGASLANNSPNKGVACCPDMQCLSNNGAWQCRTPPASNNNTAVSANNNGRNCVAEPSYGKACNTNGGPECCETGRSCFRANPNSTAGVCM
jgi:hypothetical protein